MMPPVISVLLAFVAALFRSHASLHLENLALRHQLAVYQQTIHRPQLRPTEQQQRFRDHWRRLSQQGNPGRPAIPKEVRQLIRDMWQANPTWGSPRMVLSQFFI